MKNYYNLDGIKTELNKTISCEKTLLSAWEKVTFPTKKNGEPFAVMSKNIDGATYESKTYALQYGENELVVYDWDKLNGYVTDSIDCYELVKYLKSETKIAKTENYLPKQSYLEQVYKYDIEDIKTAVANRIEYLKKRVESLSNQLVIVEDCYNSFKYNYSKAVAELATSCSAAGNVGFSGCVNDIYYMILETVKERYPYC